MHALFVHLRVFGALQEYPNLGVRQLEPAVDVPAGLAELFFPGIESGGPESDAGVWVIDVDDEVGETAAMAHVVAFSSWSMCSCTTAAAWSWVRASEP